MPIKVIGNIELTNYVWKQRKRDHSHKTDSKSISSASLIMPIKVIGNIELANYGWKQRKPDHAYIIMVFAPS